jgi:hypothetical protein
VQVEGRAGSAKLNVIGRYVDKSPSTLCRRHLDQYDVPTQIGE